MIKTYTIKMYGLINSLLVNKNVMTNEDNLVIEPENQQPLLFNTWNDAKDMAKPLNCHVVEIQVTEEIKTTYKIID